MTDLQTIRPDQLPVITEPPEDAHVLVASPDGPLQRIPQRRLLGKLIATELVKATRVGLNGDLAHPADSVALVFSDPNGLQNGWYRKTGASGSGAWVQFETLAKAVWDDIQSGAAAGAGLANYRSTLAAGVADFAVGTLFSSDAEGSMSVYRRIATAPFYAKLYDVPTKALVDTKAATADLAAATGAQGVGSKLPAVAAEPRTVGDKLAELIDTFDALTPAQRASVRSANLSADCATAINAILRYASGGESGSGGPRGARLLFRGGAYRSSAPITNTFRHDNSIVDDGDLRRVNLEGEGSAVTSLFYDGPAGTPFYQVRGYNVNTGRDLYHIIKGLRLRRMWGMRLQGTGVRLMHVADIHMDDGHIDGFNLGLDAQDVIGFSSDRLYILGNNVGLWARKVDWSNPNSWVMRGGKISGNQEMGARFTAAANVLLDSVRLEGNCTDRTAHRVLFFENAPPEGGAWATLRNLYAEGNNALYDAAFENGTADIGTILLQGNTWSRISAANFSRYHLNFYTAAGRMKVAMDAEAFKSFNDYAPNSANKIYRLQSAGIAIEERATLQQNDIEDPELNGFPVRGRGPDRLVARARVTSAGVLASGWNVASVSKTGTGLYELTYKVNPAVAALGAISGETIGATGQVVLTAEAGNKFTVTTYNSASPPVPADLNFTVSAYGEPAR